MKRALAALLASSALALAPPALALTPAQAAVLIPLRTLCPYGLGLGDGCGPPSVTGNSFQRQNFVAYAVQSGQKSALGLHAPHGRLFPWNWACVDYRCGYFVGTLTAASSATLPSGCAYQTTGGGVAATAPRVFCHNVTNPALSGIDLTNGGTTCVTLEFLGASGTITVDDFKVGNDDDCTSSSNFNGWLIKISGSPGVTSVVLSHYQLDGNPSYCVNCYTYPILADIFDQIAGPHTFTSRYAAIVRSPGRVLTGSTGTPANMTWQDYYIDGINMGGNFSGLHGEMALNTQSTNAAVSLEQYTNGEILAPSTSPICPSTLAACSGVTKASNTAAMDLSAGSNNGTTFTLVEVDHTVVVTNTNNIFSPGTPYPPTSAGLFEVSYNHYTTLTFLDDAIDPNGAENCAVSTSSPTIGAQSWTEVRNLSNNSPITGFDGSSACAGSTVFP